MDFRRAAEHIKVQAQDTGAQFRKLPQFLEEEERAGSAGRGAEELPDEGEDGGSGQTGCSSFRHIQGHRGGAES